MTRNATKTTLKRQRVSLTKEERVYRDVKKYAKDEKLAKKLIEKYGVNCAYAIVRQCMQEPGNVIKRINPQAAIYKTSDVIKYMAESNLSDTKVASGIKKTTQFVANSKKGKNTTPQAQAKQARVVQKTEKRRIVSKQAVKTAGQPPLSLQQKPVAAITNPLFVKPDNPFDKFKPTEQLKPQKTVDEQVADELARLKKENPNGVTLGALKDEGFSAGINSQVITPDKLKYLHAGKDGKGLGNAVKAATRQVVGKNQCGAAVRIGYTNYMNATYHANVSKNEAEFYGRRENGKLEWGSRAAETLYTKFDSDHFTVLSYPNKGTNSGLNNVPDGTTIFYEGKDGKKLNGKEHPGHTATYNAADGCWYAGNYSQAKYKINNGAGYGKNYRIAIANDTKVDDELLKQIIREQIKQNEWQKNNCVLKKNYRGR